MTSSGYRRLDNRRDISSSWQAFQRVRVEVDVGVASVGAPP